MIKKIGILTSGGDSPGMNAALVGAIRTGISLNKEMYVIYGGYKGLIEKKFQKVDRDFAFDRLNQGGTLIHTARLPEFKELDVQKQAVKILKEEGIDALIVIGGDGSYMGAKKLTDLGINCVGLPGTIDNDIVSTDYTIGFDTALNTVVEDVDKIRDTMSSHNRCGVVQIMGNHCPDLTVFAGVATAADYIITNDSNFDKEDLFKTLIKKKEANQACTIVLVAEKFLKIDELVAEIQQRTGWETRGTILGHTQRGGKPTAMERVNAIRMASYAVELLDKGIGGVCVGIVENKLHYSDIEHALSLPRNKHLDLYEVQELIK